MRDETGTKYSIFERKPTTSLDGSVHHLLFCLRLLLPRVLQVDAVSSESTADVRRWRRAQIVEESSTGRLRLSFEALPDYTDEWVGRDSPNIAPPGYVTSPLPSWLPSSRKLPIGLLSTGDEFDRPLWSTFASFRGGVE